jgi:hypothetical protein
LAKNLRDEAAAQEQAFAAHKQVVDDHERAKDVQKQVVEIWGQAIDDLAKRNLGPRVREL